MWTTMISVLFGWMVIDFIYNLHFKKLNKEVANLKNELKLEANSHALSVQTGQESLDKLQNKYNNHKDLNELIEKTSMALIMYKKSELLKSFSFSDNKELLTAFLICNLNSNQKQIQTKVSEIFNENFSSLMKSGIIQKLNDRFIEHGDSINSDKLKKDLQNMINFVVDNNIKNIPIKLNMEAIKEYKEILGESSHDLLNNFVQSTKNQQNRQRAQPVYSR
jgi:S-adenosylmethionine:tRNA-ribosyltransferase-isomerase (queuine synthetase)